MSVICVNEQRPKPIPKPRKRKESLPTNTKSTECLDDITDKTSDPACAPAKPGSLYTSSAVSGSVPLLPGLGIDQADDETTMYLQLDAEAMQKAQRKDDSRMNDKKAHPLLKRRSSPGLLDQSAMPQAPPLSHVKDDCSTAEDSLALKKQILKPLLLSPPRTSSYENSDEPIYVKIPPSGPPTPPPRDQDFKFTRGKPCTSSLNSPLSHPKRLSVIDEKDESLKSPYAAGAPGLVRPQGMTQSMKSPRRGEAQTLAPPRPNLSRQGSRGDVLISQVLCNVKAKVSRSWELQFEHVVAKSQQSQVYPREHTAKLNTMQVIYNRESVCMLTCCVKHWKNRVATDIPKNSQFPLLVG